MPMPNSPMRLPNHASAVSVVAHKTGEPDLSFSRDQGGKSFAEALEMRRLQMQVECSSVVVDFVEDDRLGCLVGNHDVELPTTGLVLHGMACIVARRGQECIERTRADLELRDHD